MTPAKPPLPKPSKRPFQPEAGSHASKRISESEEGLIVPATLQKAGRFGIGRPPGGGKDPAGTASASVMDVWASESFARLSQGAAMALAARAMAASSSAVGFINETGMSDLFDDLEQRGERRAAREHLPLRALPVGLERE